MGFARAIVFAAQNYRDTMQSVLPSYRERIVQHLVRKAKALGYKLLPTTDAASPDARA